MSEKFDYLIPWEEIMEEYGITQEDLEGWEDVEIDDSDDDEDDEELIALVKERLERYYQAKKEFEEKQKDVDPSYSEDNMDCFDVCRVRCKCCEDILEYKNRSINDNSPKMLWCSCGKVGLDPSAIMYRIVGNPEDYEDLSVKHEPRKTIQELFEDAADLAAYEQAMEEYRKNPVSYPFDEFMKEMGLDDDDEIPDFVLNPPPPTEREQELMQQFLNAPDEDRDKALRELIHESNKNYEKLIK